MRRLLTPGWLACHLLALLLMGAMLWLAGWQLTRATGGNALSWGYTLQWPVFAGFVGFIWWREVRRVLSGGTPLPDDADDARPRGPGGVAAIGSVPGGAGVSGGASSRQPVITRQRPAAAAYDDRDDPELAAYNRYLAWLAANPGARPVDYPG